jgi:hypothetical protein
VTESTTPSNVSGSLAATRRIRRLAYGCVVAPVAVTALLVIANRLTDGGLAFFVNPGAAWTRWFWFSLFGLIAAGLVVLLALPARRCPRCGNGLFVSKDYRRTTTSGARGRVNVFARYCVNCGLPIGGR